jgi:hypothetical protein
VRIGTDDATASTPLVRPPAPIGSVPVAIEPVAGVGRTSADHPSTTKERG